MIEDNAANRAEWRKKSISYNRRPQRQAMDEEVDVLE